MTLYYLSIPLKVVFNVVVSLIALFRGPKQLTSKGVDCRAFNQMYYFLDNEQRNDSEIQRIKRSFLQKDFGIVKYSNATVKVSAGASDVAYATLGALKDYESGNIPDYYEESIFGIIENNLSIKKLEPTLDDAHFGPNIDLTSENAVAIVAALTLLSRMGSIEARIILEELLWKRGYIFFLIFPDLNKLETLTVSYYVLWRLARTKIRYFYEAMALLSGVLSSLYKFDFHAFLIGAALEEKSEKGA